jgi:hypothetical protein
MWHPCAWVSNERKGGETNADENSQGGSRRGKLRSDTARSTFADRRIVWAPHPLSRAGESGSRARRAGFRPTV